MQYTGSCHCKAVQFAFESDEINSGLQCNCSICKRKNAIMSVKSYLPSEFRLLCGQDSLSSYHWGDHDVNHYFCNVCGIYPFHDTSFEPGKFRVNLGCIDKIEPNELDIIYFDGKNDL